MLNSEKINPEFEDRPVASLHQPGQYSDLYGAAPAKRTSGPLKIASLARTNDTESRSCCTCDKTFARNKGSVRNKCYACAPKGTFAGD